MPSKALLDLNQLQREVAGREKALIAAPAGMAQTRLPTLVQRLLTIRPGPSGRKSFMALGLFTSPIMLVLA